MRFSTFLAGTALGLSLLSPFHAFGQESATVKAKISLSAEDLRAVQSYSSGATLKDFSEGPYGLEPYTIVPPFTLPVQRIDGSSGTWDFRQSYSEDEVYVFVTTTEAAFFTNLFNSSRVNFLRIAPQNTRFFFLGIGNVNATQQAQQFRTNFSRALDSLPAEAKAYWSQRLYFVPTPVQQLTGWFTDMQFNRIQRDTTYYPIVAIDRHQRMREGSPVLYFLSNNPVPDLQFLSLEALGLHSEYALEQQAKKEEDLVLTIFDNQRSDGGWGSGQNAYTTVTLPPAAELQKYNSMTAEISLRCVGDIDENCPDWDRIIAFYVCDQENENSCGTEFARIITPYKRSGTWYSDITPMLALFNKTGGNFRFRFTDVDRWQVTVKLRLRRDPEVQGYPAEIEPLFRGGLYNGEYNSRYTPITAQAPEGTIKTEIAGLVTGHGFNAEPANCAEFCPHSHHFAVNGTEYVLQHPRAGTNTGCIEQIPQGVVPNQYGTWYFGRAGWCPGMDVKMFRGNVTPSWKAGDNTISYRSLLNGVPFNPASLTPTDNPPSISMTTYLVHWKNFPVTSVNEQTAAQSSVSPNPATDVLRLSFAAVQEGIMTVEFVSAFGNVVSTPIQGLYAAGEHSATVKISHLAAGVYFARIIQPNGMISVQKFVVVK